MTTAYDIIYTQYMWNAIIILGVFVVVPIVGLWLITKPENGRSRAAKTSNGTDELADILRSALSGKRKFITVFLIPVCVVITGIILAGIISAIVVEPIVELIKSIL